MPVFELVDADPAGWLNYKLIGRGPQKVVMLAGFLTSLEALRPLSELFGVGNEQYQVNALHSMYSACHAGP